MNRRGLIKSLFATAALATGLARTRIAIAEPRFLSEDIILDDLVMSLEEFNLKYIRPAMKELAAGIERDSLALH